MEYVQEEPQIQNIAHEWHQEQEQTNHDRQDTSQKPKKNKATSAIFPTRAKLFKASLA